MQKVRGCGTPNFEKTSKIGQIPLLPPLVTRAGTTDICRSYVDQSIQGYTTIPKQQYQDHSKLAFSLDF